MTITLQKFKDLEINELFKKLEEITDLNISQKDELSIDPNNSFDHKFKNLIDGNDLFITLVNEESNYDDGQNDLVYVYELSVSNTNVKRYARVSGYYASYEGYEWDDEFIEVYPRQVTVTQFFTEKE